MCREKYAAHDVPPVEHMEPKRAPENTSLGAACWRPHKDCLSEFSYNGKLVHNCTDADSVGVFWCSKMEEVNALSDAVNFREPCTLKSECGGSDVEQPVDEVVSDHCWLPHARCLSEFQFQYIDVAGCTLKGFAASPWCSDKKVVDAPSDLTCTKVPCEECHIPDPQCKPTWSMKDKVTEETREISGCAWDIDHPDLDPGQSWCSLKSHYEHGSNFFAPCTPCQTERMVDEERFEHCWIKHADCAQEFSHKNKTYKGCIEQASGSAVCSETSNPELDEKWKNCRACEEREFGALTTYTTTISPKFTLDITSQAKSVKIDLGVEIARCPAGYTRASCNCVDTAGSCAGISLKNGVCTAYNKRGGSGVWARARCIRFPAGATWSTARMLGSRGVAVVRVACEKGFQMVSCDCFNEHGSCAAANINGSFCVAHGIPGEVKDGLVAEAHCAKIPAASRWQTEVATTPSAALSESTSVVSCPKDLTLLSCSCWSEDGSCAGGKALENSCIAVNRVGGTGVRALARCAELRQDQWCWAFDGLKSRCDAVPAPAQFTPSPVKDLRLAKRACEHLGSSCEGIVATEMLEPLMLWEGCYHDPQKKDFSYVPKIQNDEKKAQEKVEWNAESCGKACLLEGYGFIAMRRVGSSIHCFCGHAYATHESVSRFPDSSCGKQCVEEHDGAFQPCGTAHHNAIYRVGKAPQKKKHVFALEESASAGMSSSCNSLRCTTTSDGSDVGLSACKEECEKFDKCNAFNFCPKGGPCQTANPAGRCCMLECHRSNTTLDYNLKLIDSLSGWDVYRKEPTPRFYKTGPKVADTSIPVCEPGVWAGTALDAKKRCDLTEGCSLIASSDCGEKSWRVCKSSLSEITPPRFSDSDRSGCTKIVVGPSSWLPCIGRCKASQANVAVQCPSGTFLTEITLSMELIIIDNSNSSNASNASDVANVTVLDGPLLPEKGQCSDGTTIQLAEASTSPNVTRWSVRQPEGFSALSLANASGIRLVSLGFGPCTIDGPYSGASNSTCTVGKTTEETSNASRVFVECPSVGQALSGLMMHQEGSLVKGLELLCTRTTSKKHASLPCEGKCLSENATLRSCPPGAVIQNLTFAGNNGTELYLVGGTCTDGTILRDRTSYPGVCRDSHLKRFSLTTKSQYGVSEWSMNEDIFKSYLTAFKLGRCLGESPECSLTAPNSEQTVGTKTMKCPGLGQRLSGWKPFTSCHLEGIQFMCTDTPRSPGWLRCQGNCNGGPSAMTTAECPEGSFVESLVLAHDDRSRVFIQSGQCTDGTIIGAGATSTCSEEFSSTHKINAPGGANVIHVHGLDDYTADDSSKTLSFVGLGNCADAECEFGWKPGRRKELRCSKIGQRIAGWSMHATCGIFGVEVLCREPVEPDLISEVKYCKPNTFEVNTKKYTAKEPRPLAYINTTCSSFCDAFHVDDGSNASYNGKYVLSADAPYSDHMPTWSFDQYLLKRYNGKWLIEVNGSTIFKGGRGGSPTPGRWSPTGSVKGPGVLVLCWHEDTTQSFDPCWKPHPKCVSAFTFEGKTYKGCTMTMSTQHWCGTDVFVTREKDWALCSDDLACREEQRTGSMAVESLTVGHDCFVPAPSCERSFYYKGRLYTECVHDHNDGSVWCSEDKTFEDSIGRWKPCRKTICKEGKVTNLAFQRHVDMSSAADGGPANRATDGDTGAGKLRPYGKCAQTLAPQSDQGRSWIKVDLEDEYPVLSIKLTGRDDDLGYQSRGWTITVGMNGTDDDAVCADGIDAAGGEAVTYKCGLKPLGDLRPSGRYVVVWSSSPIVLCEIEVMGQTCHRPHPDCVDTFVLPSNENELVSGCFMDKFHAPWCSIDGNYSGRFRACEIVPCSQSPAPEPVVEACVKPDPKCAPIFNYEGHSHHGCTEDGASGTNQFGEPKEWCSLDSTFKNRRSDCSEVPCMDCFVRDQRCVESFTYNGETYVGCTMTDSSAFWCSLIPDFDGNSKNRKFCSKCTEQEFNIQLNPMKFIDGWPASRFCWKPEARCVKDFMLEGNPEQGCIGKMYRRPWCSRNDRFNGDWGMCEPDLDGWQPHQDCVEVFSYDGGNVVGCVRDNTFQVPWCSVEQVFNGDFRPCTKCAAEPGNGTKTGSVAALGKTADVDLTLTEDCYEPASTCVPVFQYNGERIEGCTNKDSFDWWCSHAEVYAEDRGYSKCTKTFCRTANAEEHSEQPQVEVESLFTVANLKFDEIGADLLGQLTSALTQTIGDHASVNPNKVKLTLSGGDASLAALTGSRLASEKQTLDVRSRTAGAGDLRVRAIFFVAESDADPVKVELRTSQTRASIVHTLEALPGINNVTDGQLSISEIKVMQQAAKAANSPDACYQLAPDCVPTFEFEGKNVVGCIKEGSDHHWCSRHHSFQGSTSRCLNVPCGDCWHPTSGCQRSFEYKGSTYADCTNVDSDHQWCSLVSSLESDSNEWKLCTPCAPHEQITASHEEECFEPVKECVSSFEFKGKFYNGCTRDFASEYWCSLHYDLEEREVEGTKHWKACKPCGQASIASNHERCYLPNDDCVGSFEFKGMLYTGCTMFGSSQHWCSKDLEFKGDTRWAICEPVGCSTCFVRHNNCVSRFTHNGEEVRGCAIDEETGGAWCTSDPVFQDTSPQFPCEPCEPKITESEHEDSVCQLPAPKCQPNFEYAGKKHVGCITANASKPWCPFKYLHLPGSEDWTYCSETSCKSCFIPDARCASSFTYNGETYERCVNQPGKAPWCSREPDFEEGVEWFECTPCPQPSVDEIEEEQCYEQHPSCVPNFIFEDEMYAGCTAKGSTEHWCSEDHIFDKQFQTCRRVSCDSCYIRHVSCLSEFMYKGKKVVGCTTEDAESGEPWCSKDAVVDGVRENWARCSMCRREGSHTEEIQTGSLSEAATSVQLSAGSISAKCYQPSSECVPNFRYAGRSFTGCTNFGTSFHWCSLKLLLDEGDQKNYAICQETPCSSCYIRGPYCKANFRFKEQEFSGCTNHKSDDWWCSNDEDFDEVSGSWDLCTRCDSLTNGHVAAKSRCWKPSSDCVESFTYKSKSYTGCTSVDSDQHWCSKDSDFDASGRFALCSEVDCDDELEHNKLLQCYEPPLTCAPAFFYEGKRYQGCTSVDADFHWCSHDKLFSLTSKFSRCVAVSCDKCVLRAPSCVPAFGMEDGRQIEGCTKLHSNTGWCSQDVKFDSLTTEWSACTKCEGYQKVYDKVCHQPAAECVRNFFFNGMMISGCTDDGRDHHWCSTVRNFETNSSDYLPCNEKRCEECWVKAPGCLSHFEYLGTGYSGCTSEHMPLGWNTAWCSFEEELKEGSDRWAFCEPCQETNAPQIAPEKACWKPHPNCLQPFKVDGAPTSGCLFDPMAQKAWCSKIPNFNSLASTAFDYEWCEEIECTSLCWQPSAGCKHFYHEGRLVTGCDESGGGIPWCATSGTYDPEAGNWQYCKAADCKDVCFLADKSCVQPFEYLGKLTVGCSTEGATSPWCSETSELLEGATTWRYCHHEECSNICYAPPFGCTQPYEYEGKARTGCVKPSGYDHHVCPKGSVLETATLHDSVLNGSVLICPQISCGEVCYKPMERCMSEWMFNGTKQYGCLTDKTLLNGQRPWCSHTQYFSGTNSSWEYCPELSCSQVSCGGPVCDDFLLLRVQDGRCVQVENRNPSLPSFGLVLDNFCPYPDGNGYMVKEVPLADGYVMFQHISGRCLHPDQFDTKKLVVKEHCADIPMMRFKRLNTTGLYAKYRHYSDRCIDTETSDTGVPHLVLSAYCTASSTVTAAALTEARSVSDARNGALSVKMNTKSGVLLKPWPLPCLWSEWDMWSACTVTCSTDNVTGSRIRLRSVLRVQEESGKPCTGFSNETAACGPACASVCHYGDWADWAGCTEACGGGLRVRQKIVINQPKGIRQCPSVNESYICNTQSCATPCELGDWSEWSTCTSSCGGKGTRYRTKEVAKPAVNGGKTCRIPKEYEMCGQDPCPRHCSLGPWAGWSGCSKSCGVGADTRSRTIEVASLFGGKGCGTIPFETRDCNTMPCPVDCVWDEWLEWDKCTLTCGGGFRARRREKTPAQHGGKHCHPGSRQEDVCNLQPCPINCVFSEWDQWSTCSRSCAGGVQQRERYYAQIVRHGGVKCNGPMLESQECSARPCPVDCIWNLWKEWSICSLSCGGGLQSRNRVRLQKMHFGGKPCIGYDIEYIHCNKQTCPIDCVWYPWGSFSPCSVTCGGGEKKRFRTRKTVSEYSGVNCNEPESEMVVCNTHNCPRDCSFGEWTRWSECDKSCGVGMQNRVRTETRELFDGKKCQGKLRQERACNIRACPIDCLIDPWSPWTACTVTCNGGQRVRERNMVYSQHGGKKCHGDKREVNECGMDPCPINCEWFTWQAWHSCSTTCGKGKRLRLRDKNIEAKNGGRSCSGSKEQFQACAEWDCPIDCVWDDWQSWSKCTKSCGGGKRWRQRGVRVRSQYGGNVCRGAERVKRWCNTNVCPSAYLGKLALSDQVLPDSELQLSDDDAPPEAEEIIPKPAEHEREREGTMVTLIPIVLGAIGVVALIYLCKSAPTKSESDQ
eukprot:TRINITY_DN27124_c0_g2_i1.p1 TRINITY_DN27124_c0_g2~~TRINITY_DN27124_c0_g2_i1.p1  ORF type:complete len:4551 (-),score=367.55 TRINITY_DN27124_c0_g2_i1:202-13791(-)